MSIQSTAAAISKVLSANDTGENGAHQAGMLIPKQEPILGFFPKLSKEVKNPRVKIPFIDENGKEWIFTYIYYNNKYFDGTRNEYRLTGMTAYIRENNLMAGDKIVLAWENNNQRYISFEKVKPENVKSNILKLGGSWKVVKI